MEWKVACELASARSQPLTLSLSPTEPILPKRGEGKIPGDVLTQGSSFLATAGLICETRFGVFKMDEDKKIFGFGERKGDL